jgi:hypothetical protein
MLTRKAIQNLQNKQKEQRHKTLEELRNKIKTESKEEESKTEESKTVTDKEIKIEESQIVELKEKSVHLKNKLKRN